MVVSISLIVSKMLEATRRFAQPIVFLKWHIHTMKRAIWHIMCSVMMEPPILCWKALLMASIVKPRDIESLEMSICNINQSRTWRSRASLRLSTFIRDMVRLWERMPRIQQARLLEWRQNTIKPIIGRMYGITRLLTTSSWISITWTQALYRVSRWSNGNIPIKLPRISLSTAIGITWVPQVWAIRRLLLPIIKSALWPPSWQEYSILSMIAISWLFLVVMMVLLAWLMAISGRSSLLPLLLGVSQRKISWRALLLSAIWSCVLAMVLRVMMPYLSMAPSRVSLDWTMIMVAMWSRLITRMDLPIKTCHGRRRMKSMWVWISVFSTIVSTVPLMFISVMPKTWLWREISLRPQVGRLFGIISDG